MNTLLPHLLRRQLLKEGLRDHHIMIKLQKLIPDLIISNDLIDKEILDLLFPNQDSNTDSKKSNASSEDTTISNTVPQPQTSNHIRIIQIKPQITSMNKDSLSEIFKDLNSIDTEQKKPTNTTKDSGSDA